MTMRKLLIAVLFSIHVMAAGQVAKAWDFSCEPAALTSHSFHGQDSSYIVTRRCTHTYNSSEKVFHDITYSGSWKGATEVASEHVTDRTRYYDGGDMKNDQTYQYNVTSKCLQDPWLTGMDCYSHHVDHPYPDSFGSIHSPPNPKGAAVLPASVRQTLQQEYYAQREAPTILEPANNELYSLSATIPIRVEHNPAHGIRFKIEWRPDAQHALQGVGDAIITGEQDSNGILTAKLHPIKEGEWTVRAQLDTNTSPWWSDPVTFTVQSAASQSSSPSDPETTTPTTGALTAPNSSSLDTTTPTRLLNQSP